MKKVKSLKIFCKTILDYITLYLEYDTVSFIGNPHENEVFIGYSCSHSFKCPKEGECPVFEKFASENHIL